MATENKMFAIEPVTLNVTLTVTRATANGLLGGVTDVTVNSANGDADNRFYGFASNYGSLVLNFKADGRPAKPVKADKPAPRSLTAAQKAQIAALDAKIDKIMNPAHAAAAAARAKAAKAKAAEAKAAEPAPEPTPAAAPDMAAIVAAVMAAMAAK